MIVTNIAGTSEIITDYTNLTRKRRVNGEHSLSFLLPKTERNEHSFDLVEDESIQEYDGVSYRIKGLVEQVKGKPLKSITSYHTFFDIVDEYRYTTLTTGFKSINEVLSFIFSGLPWTFTVIDPFPTVEFENFGNDNCLSLFQKVIDRYQAEYEILGNEVRLKKKIGSYPDFQFRYGYNIKTFKRTVDTSNLSTYIKGTGKLNEDGTPIVEAEYTSPMAAIYGIRHAPPYSNEAITHYDTLLENMKAKLQDTPMITIELEFVSLQEQGYPSANPGLGDTVPTIYEPLNIDVDLRIIEIEDYPEAKKSPKVILSNVPKSFVNAVMNYQKSLLDKVYDENSGKLKYNVYDEAVKRATEALNNSLTQLEYPVNMGILARDPENPNAFTVLRAKGIGITSDGGVTFPDAITPYGINTALLTAGQIKTNNIQLVGNLSLLYMDGNEFIAIDPTDPSQITRIRPGELYTKGTFTAEREDGYKTVIGGKLNQDFNIQGGSPPQLVDAFIEGRFFATNSMDLNGATCDIYTFTRQARYVVFQVAVMSEVDTAQSRVIVTESGNDSVWLGGVSGFSTSEEVKSFYIDLGTPNGATFAFRLRLKTYQSNSKAFCRVIRLYQTDFLPQGV